MKSNYPSHLDTALALRRQLRPAGLNSRLSRPNSNLLSLSLPLTNPRASAAMLWDPLRLDRLKAPLTRYRD